MDHSSLVTRHSSRSSPVDTARLGMLLFLAAEAMFFAGWVAAYLVFRIGAEVWPPPGQPRLPALIAGVGTVVFILSAGSMRRAYRHIRLGFGSTASRWLYPTLGLGICFLGIQGYEWTNMVQSGLTLSSGPYGFTYHTVVGFHLMHAATGVIWLAAVLAKTRRGDFSATHHTGFDMVRMYWYFVVGIWPPLYGLMYIY